MRRPVIANRNHSSLSDCLSWRNSFGNSFTIVDVTADDSKAQVWIAPAKPSQALTLVLAAVSEGWTAEVLDVLLPVEQQRTFEELKLEPCATFTKWLNSERGLFPEGHSG